MSSAFPEDVTFAPGEDHREQVKLARKWARVLDPTAYIPLPAKEIEHELLLLVRRLCAAAGREPFDGELAVPVGARLVQLNCNGPTSLQLSAELLGKSLLALPALRRVGDLADRVVTLLGSLAKGYVDASHDLILEQQENVSQALLKAAKAAEWNLKVSEALANEVFTSSPTGIAVTDLQGRFVRCNDALGDLLGHPSPELAALTLPSFVHSDDVPVLLDAYRDLVGGTLDRVQQRHRLVRRDGELVRASLAVALLRDGDDKPDHFVTIVEDVSEVTLLGGQLTHQSLHDALTGLPNRQFFTTRLETALRQADPTFGVTLYHLDLDAFSVITDGLGRRVGDLLLKVVADRLRSVVVGERAMVARFEGDEFAILVENAESTPNVVSTINRINEELAEPVYLDGYGVAVSASVGVVDRPSRGLEPAELLRASDMTLRRAKNSGRRQWGLFDAEQNARERELFSLAAVMPGAWESGQIDVVFRPEVSLAGNAVIGLEALLSWTHPDLGVIPHQRCVRMAEQTGLIVPLGNWMLRTAADQIRWWHQRSGRDLPLSIALTPNQSSDPDLVGAVLKVLSQTGLRRESLRLGMPVRSLSADHDEAVDNLQVLAEAGIGTMAHDFTGAIPELTCLAGLPVQGVRVARPLVERPAADDSVTAHALADLVAFAHAAGRTVLVDGIAGRQQADWWRSAGADTAVGSHFGGGPGPLTALLDL
jgi:diguanylate cyclase (GGDEF)-like protein/PAS domain S-box-containing protein